MHYALKQIMTTYFDQVEDTIQWKNADCFSTGLRHHSRQDSSAAQLHSNRDGI